jgi:hypothetical protein
MVRVLPAFLKSWAGVEQIIPALAVAAQAIAGRPGWLRQFLGKDHYRIVPDIDCLPKVGNTLQLGGAAFEETPLIAGWHKPEPTGRWTHGREATVAWCVRGQNRDLTLLIDGVPAMHEKVPPQRIELWANDRHLASWCSQMDLLSQQPTRILVPHGLMRNRDVLMLTFLIRRPVCPATTDTRALGLHLRSLTLNAAQHTTSGEFEMGGSSVAAPI